MKNRSGAPSKARCPDSAAEPDAESTIQETQHDAHGRQDELQGCCSGSAVAPQQDVPRFRELRMDRDLPGDSDPAILRIANEALKSILPIHSRILDQGYHPVVVWLGHGTFGIVLGLVKDGKVTVAIKIGKQGGTFQDIVSGDFGREAAQRLP